MMEIGIIGDFMNVMKKKILVIIEEWLFESYQKVMEERIMEEKSLGNMVIKWSERGEIKKREKIYE